MMSKLQLGQIKKKSISGVFTLTGRTVILQLISFLGYFFITIFLKTEDFGLFILVSTIIDILGYFSDVGLAAALVQKKEKLNLKEIRATFTLQQLLVMGAILLSLLLSPLIKKYYNLGSEGVVLLYSFMFAFFCSSLKTIPSVLLERKLEFTKIVIPQLVETVLFYAVVVFLAWQGWGVKSYTVAVVVRAVSGTLLMYIIAPWKIGINFCFRTLKQLLKFGIPYQGNSLIALIKDKFMVLFLGTVIGKKGIALVGWAEKWANMPLRYFLDSTLKVVFPAFSRLQHQKEKLQRAVEASLYFLSFLVFPSVIGLAVISSSFVKIIPKYSKWEPALIPLYFYSVSACWAVVSTLLTNALTAVGKIKVVFKLMIMWTVLSWIFTPFLAARLGFRGVALASALVAFSSYIAVLAAKKYFSFSLSESVLPAFFSSGLMALILFFIKRFLPLTIVALFAQILLGVFIYLSVMLLINKNKLLKEARILLSYVKK